MALRERVAAIVDPPPPPPPPNEPRTRRTLRSSTLFSPTVGTTADIPVALTDIPPWLDTRPPPPEMQESSQTLLSQTQVQADDGLLTITATTVPGTRAHNDDGFLPISATRGRGTTKAAAAFLPPATVGIPDRGPPNTYASLDDGLSVATPDRQEDELQPVTGRAVADSTTIQAVVDKSFDDFYGPDAPTDPTTLRFRGLFDDGARMVDRILSDINEEQKRHEERTSQQMLSTCGTLRAEVSTLQMETGDALILLRRETTDALTTALNLLRKETTDSLTIFKQETVTRIEMTAALQPTINSFAGLTATAHRLEAWVTNLAESSARATQDILVLRRDLDGGALWLTSLRWRDNRNRR
jgi:hypothetical protein